ncbi:MAG: hypothetical protein O6952_09350 [Planctomycetota bacterium]|nr:hypothetical protein [Planctomycetota bacterium]
MGIWSKLFGKEVTAKELKVSLRKIERERRRRQQEIRKLEAKRGTVVERIKKARKQGNNLEVDYLWEDLTQLKMEGILAMKSARRSNLEAIGLKRYVRGLERLEKNKDKEGIRKLFTRVAESGLDTKLGVEEINEEEYLDELQMILEDAGLNDQELDREEEDPEKAKFLSQIDAINDAEEAGDFEAATQKEEKLKSAVEPMAEEED